MSLGHVSQVASQRVLVVKNPPATAGDVRDVVSIPGSGKSPRGWHPASPQGLFNPRAGMIFLKQEAD